jgi:hypothetical protein
VTSEIESRTWLTVEDRAAAAVLTAPDEFKFLRPFMNSAKSVTSAAKELNVSVLSMYRRVKHFEKLGLLKIARLKPRKGKPTKLYRTSADAFFVPFHASPYSDLFSFMLERQDVWQRRLLKGIVGNNHDELFGMGLCFYTDESEHVRVTRGSAPGKMDSVAVTLEPQAPATWNDWSTISLEFEEAKNLQHELHALLTKYLRHSSQPNAKKYILRTALAPVVD